MEKIKEFLRGICACLAAGKMYPVTHPQVKDIIDEVYSNVEEIFKERDELIIGIVEDEIVFDNQVLFDLNVMLQQLVAQSKKKGIEKFYFYEHMKKPELVKFITFLLSPKEEKDIDVQEQLSMLGVNNIRVSSLTTPFDDDSKREGETFEQAYERLLEELSQYFEEVLDGRLQSDDIYGELKYCVFNIFQNYKGKYQEVLNIDFSKKFDQTLLHSFRVALLSIEFSTGLDFVEEDVLDIGLAALFHDIGKIYKVRKASDGSHGNTEKIDFAQNPSVLGAEILLRFRKELGILPFITAFESSMRHDESDDSELSYPHKPNIASFIVAICSYYDDMILEEKYKPDYSPDKLYEIITKENNGRFYPQLLERFFKIVGVWPLGSILALSDGKIAIVREENEDSIFLPKVEIIFPQEENKIIDLKTKKDEIAIKAYLDPQKEGKKYIHLV